MAPLRPLPPPRPPTEFQKPAALARQLDVTRKTVLRWADKGAVEVRRVAPGVGVRVRLKPE